jgi:hypothetical protein
MVFHRNHGRQNRHQAHEYQQTLSAAEEDELVEWLRELDRWGLHLRRSLVINRVDTMVAEKATSHGLPVPDPHLSTGE